VEELSSVAVASSSHTGNEQSSEVNRLRYALRSDPQAVFYSPLHTPWQGRNSFSSAWLKKQAFLLEITFV
jgi:hypothetical protein